MAEPRDVTWTDRATKRLASRVAARLTVEEATRQVRAALEVGAVVEGFGVTYCPVFRRARRGWAVVQRDGEGAALVISVAPENARTLRDLFEDEPPGVVLSGYRERIRARIRETGALDHDTFLGAFGPKARGRVLL